MDDTGRSEGQSMSPEIYLIKLVHILTLTMQSLINCIRCSIIASSLALGWKNINDGSLNMVIRQSRCLWQSCFIINYELISPHLLIYIYIFLSEAVVVVIVW
jgi:hypothetical protein